MFAFLCIWTVVSYNELDKHSRMILFSNFCNLAKVVLLVDINGKFANSIIGRISDLYKLIRKLGFDFQYKLFFKIHFV